MSRVACEVLLLNVSSVLLIIFCIAVFYCLPLFVKRMRRSPRLEGDGTFNDLKARLRRSESALLAEQAAHQEAITRVSLATQSAGIGIWDWDLATNFCKCDKQLCQLLGAHPSVAMEAPMRFWMERIHPDDRAGVEQALKSAIEGKLSSDHEFRVLWEDRTLHFLKGSGVVQVDTSGRPNRMVGAIVDVTASRAAEEQLRQCCEREQLLVLGVTDYAVFMMDTDGYVLTWNEGAERIKGYRTDEIIGCHFSKLYAPEDIVAGKPARGLSVAKEKGSFGEEGWRIRKDGSRFWASVSISPLYDPSGTLRGFGKVTRDITERKQAEAERDLHEQELRASEELLHRTGRMAGVGGWEIDLITRRVHWSDETAHLHGLAAGYQPTFEEMIQFYVPEDRLVVQAAIERAMIDGEPWELEAQVLRLDGGRIWAMVKGSVEFAGGEAVRMIGAFQDVTTRVRAQMELRYQANLLDLSHDTIMMRDIDGGIRFWNRGAQEMYGYSKKEAVGKFSHLLLHAVFARPLAEIEAELLEKGRWEGEVQHRTRSGQQIVVASRWALQADQNGQTFNVLETNNDITERLRAAALRQAKLEAEAANHAKSEFLAHMSHEIRTPMNAIIGMTHLALRAQPSEKQRNYLEKISSAADSLLNIINDILDFSKMEAGKMELENIAFSVEKVIQHVNDIVSLSAHNKNLEIDFSICEEVPAVLVGDPLRLGQVLINLVHNAIKFTRDGRISVKVSATELINGSANVCFAVTDTGIGMSAEQIAKLFQSFTQADPSVTRRFGGTGLGLAICKQLCTLMGGSLGVTSEEGKGSTFSVNARFAVAAAKPQPSAGRESFSSSKGSVLVVDDSSDAWDVMVAKLSANGFTARAVSTGEDALALLDETSACGKPLDLVLMNWRMPGVNGLETTRLIKARLEFLRIPTILMVSACDRDQVMKGASDPGLEGYLVKPVRESVLINTIDSLMRANNFQANRSMPAPSAAQPTDLSGRRVLLVEDNEINCELATELLTDLGILVTVAHDGREGLDRLEDSAFDLVLMDIQMPLMDGLTATRLVRADARYKDLPIIAMTAHAMGGDREKSLEAGMTDHLTKPISPESLTSALLRWMPVQAMPAAQAAVSTHALNEDALPEELPPFDLQAALARTNGKPKLLRKMMLGFCKQYASATADLRLLVRDMKHQEAERLVHSLKSAARTLEAGDLGNAAAAIEAAFRSGDNTNIEPLLEAMECVLAPAIQAAASLDRRSQTTPTATASLDKPGGTILIVDDDLSYLELLTDIFSNEHEVLSATDGMAAIRIAADRSPDVILLDVVMQGIDGYDVCARLKSEPRTFEIPVIFLTGLGDVANESKALAMGAVDYVTKPINPLAVRARVNLQIHLKRAQDRLLRHATEELQGQLRKEAERAAETERISKQELELRDHFLSHVSHELRSPLTSIYLFSTLIADGLAGPTNPQQDEYLGYIQKNISQLKAMIEDLLLVTAAKTGKLKVHLQATSISTAIADLQHTLQVTAEVKGVLFSTSVCEELEAYADPVRMLQILIILCDNAIKFTPSGGSVQVQARRSPDDPDRLLIEVADTGCGIDPEMSERIFEHLYQITEVNDAGRNGLGLGLHIARNLVELQGGKIWAERIPESGSRFSFTVPIFQNQQEATLV